MWMLCTLLATATEIMFLITWAVLLAGWVNMPLLKAFGAMMLLASLVVGLFCLGLTFMVYRVREEKPPGLVVGWSVIAGLAPFVLFVLADRFPPP
ncbi:hypothetical protein [Lignipirellula cremea]|nr:hypothetical protein [Lignipirellula cremea]